MNQLTILDQNRDVPSYAAIIFLLATYAIAWSLIGFLLVFPDWVIEHYDEISGAHPIFLIAAFAPAFSAFALVFYFCGLNGLKNFIWRVLMWRGSSIWALFILLGIPLVFIFGSLAKTGWDFTIHPQVSVIAMIAIVGLLVAIARYEWLFGSHFWAVVTIAAVPSGYIFGVYLTGQTDLVEFAENSTKATFMLLLFMLFLGPVEEFGWRGILQPILQRNVAPLWAGAIVGATWGIWHLPAFFLTGVTSTPTGFLPFLIGSISIGIIVTPMFNESRGSLLWPMLFHWQLVNPFWPDAHPYDSFVLLIVAVVVIWWNREALLAREHAVSEVT